MVEYEGVHEHCSKDREFAKVCMAGCHERMGMQDRIADLKRERNEYANKYKIEEARCVALERRLAEAEADADRLAGALKWTICDIVERATGEDDDLIPDHFCDYVHRPDLGECLYHHHWFQAHEDLAAHDKRRKEVKP